MTIFNDLSTFAASLPTCDDCQSGNHVTSHGKHWWYFRHPTARTEVIHIRKCTAYSMGAPEPETAPSRVIDPNMELYLDEKSRPNSIKRKIKQRRKRRKENKL